MKNWPKGIKETFSDPAVTLGTAAAISGIVLEFGVESPILVGFMWMAAIGAGVSAGIDAAIAKAEEQGSPPKDVREYTVGGWFTVRGTLQPKGVAMLQGWITKPIKVHPSGSYVMDNTGTTRTPYTTLDNTRGGFLQKQDFYTNGSVLDAETRNLSQRLCYTN